MRELTMRGFGQGWFRNARAPSPRRVSPSPRRVAPSARPPVSASRQPLSPHALRLSRPFIPHSAIRNGVGWIGGAEGGPAATAPGVCARSPGA